MPKGRLLTEHEWRHLGVQQSLGWVHFMIHEPGTETSNEVASLSFLSLEPHILLFRRSLKVSQQVQQQRAAAQAQQYNALHMK